MKKILLGVLLLTSGCATTRCRLAINEFKERSEAVTAVVFMQRHGSNANVVATVKSPARVNGIIDGIDFEREIPFTKHVFRDHAVFLQGTNECLHISFKHEPWSNRYLLRYREKQFETSEATYRLLARYSSLRRAR